ncbi:hypothetical protein C8J56DRAFT_1067330 [Mycena floridula]|nr:hypothetical protein C8J56DRAFT_1070778 [Mycena floridula]KAJ7572984.1 hypothetical protein C8J56DRAFT_1067330 [Mycena floridula]
MAALCMADIFLIASHPNRKFPFWTHPTFLEISGGVIPPFDPSFTTSHKISAYDLLAIRIYVRTFWYDPLSTSSQVLHVGETVWQKWFNNILSKRILPCLRGILNQEEDMEIKLRAVSLELFGKQALQRGSEIHPMATFLAHSIVTYHSAHHVDPAM